MEQSIKEKYKLSEEEHNEIYKKIEKEDRSAGGIETGKSRNPY